MKLYIPTIKVKAINKSVTIPPKPVVYLSFDLYLKFNVTPNESNFLRK